MPAYNHVHAHQWSGAGGGASSLLGGLQAYYTLDEGSGPRFDSGPNLYHLTDNNTVAQAAGKVNAAALFAAANSEWLSLAPAPLLGFTATPFTISAWVYLVSKATRQMFVMKGDGASGDEYFLEYDDGSDRFRFFILDDSLNYTGITANNFGSPSTATWYHLLAWFDAASLPQPTIAIRVSGGVADSTTTPNTDVDRGGSFQVGAYRGGSLFVDARVDELGVWNRVLAAGEQTGIYNGGSGTTWPFPGV